MILNQGNNDNCGSWAIMGILQHYGVPFDFDSVSKIREPLIMKLQKRFIELGLVKMFIPLPHTRLVDLWLKRGERLLTGTNFGDFTLEDNEGGIVEFDGKSQHYFILIQDCGNKYKCSNSWGPEWNGDGCFYIKKSDFKMLFAPRRIICNK